MGKHIYKATRNPDRLAYLLKQSEHVLTKHSDGSFYCQTHKCLADQCSTREDTEVVWFQTLDGGTFSAVVLRKKPYQGTLLLTRGDRNVLETQVTISYDAPFGPDAEDIIEWQRLCIEAADIDYRDNGMPRKTGR